MSNPDFRALCAELEEAYTWCIEAYMTAPAEEDTLIQRARAALAQLEPVEPVWAEIHYAWELEDADGEWQAGGSANSLDDVQREGDRYLRTYAQDGPHKLIIQRHCVITIKEVTND
jgi:hypothetical protein